MASYVDDEIDGTLGGGATTEGVNLMGATSLDLSPSGARRRGRSAAAAAAAAAATATATEAEIDWRAEALVQQQLGLEAAREKTTRLRDLTEVFKQTLPAIPAVLNQLDALQQAAADVWSGKVVASAGCRVELGSSPRVLVSLTDLLAHTNFSFYDHPILSQPCFALPAMEAAVADIWRNRGALGPPPRVGVCGWLGAHHLTPRGLKSIHLNSLVCVEGVVNRASSVHPKLSAAVYVSEAVSASRLQQQNAQQQQQPDDPQRQVHLRYFFDVTHLDKDLRDAQPPPEKDPEGRRINRQELGYCQYDNHQKFLIQEAPEASPTGQLPRWVEVAAEADLVDAVKCGDRVRVYGVYRPRTGSANNQTSGYVKPLLIANHIQVLSVAARASMLQSVPADLLNIQTFAGRKDLLQVLARSVAPAVCGNDVVKRGMVLLLAGGSERQSSSGHRIRGDIHVLLIGDPSAGKSQLLRFALGIIPGAVSATGRGSSGVGLTAAVVTDPDTGERRVEGGAMVLADKSLVCIDEFDKMQHSDRVAIHEVMEQQTVTVAKAGIHTTLNARCSVLAAANPLYGCWAADLDFKSQIAFEDSLMTRFDLIFIVRDATTAEEDERLAEAVLRNVTEKARPAAAAAAAAVASAADDRRETAADGLVQPQGDMERHIVSSGRPENATQDEGEPTKVFYHRNKMLYYDKKGREHEVLTHEFLRKYIALVRSGGLSDDPQQQQQQQREEQQDGPQLSDDAAAAIIDFYGEIRQRAQLQKRGNGAAAAENVSLLQHVTVRTLEACVRLATAHAKLRFKKWINLEDVEVAKQLLLYSLFGETFDEENALGCSSSSDEEGSGDEESREGTEAETEDDSSLQKRSTGRRSERVAATTIQRDEATKRRRGRRAVEAEDEDMASRFEGLDIVESKKRRTRQTAAAAAQDRREATEALHGQGLRKDILQSLIVTTIKLVDEGSGISESALFEAINARAASKKLSPATREEFDAALQELNAKDSAPILVHDGLVYEC